MVLSALTTSDRRRDLFDEGVYCRGQYTPEELSSWLSKRTTADQEMEPWPRFLASSFLVKEEVGWQSENCHVSEGVGGDRKGQWMHRRQRRGMDAETSSA
jgi:hypothetical protein